MNLFTSPLHISSVGKKQSTHSLNKQAVETVLCRGDSEFDQ